MTAASYWSLLAPSIEMAELSGYYGSEGQWAFVPVAVGFALGALFVYSTDVLLPYLVREVNCQINYIRYFGVEIIFFCFIKKDLILFSPNNITISLQGISDANLSLALTTSPKVDKDSGSEDSVEIGLPDDENAYKQCKK